MSACLITSYIWWSWSLKIFRAQSKLRQQQQVATLGHQPRFGTGQTHRQQLLPRRWFQPSRWDGDEDLDLVRPVLVLVTRLLCPLMTGVKRLGTAMVACSNKRGTIRMTIILPSREELSAWTLERKMAVLSRRGRVRVPILSKSLHFEWPEVSRIYEHFLFDIWTFRCLKFER